MGGHAKENLGPYSLDAEAGRSESQEQLVVKVITTWKGYLWDTWELPQDQRWLLFKVDAFVLTFASVGTRLQWRWTERNTTVLTQGSLGWLLPQEPRSEQRQQCLPQRHGGRPADVRQPARNQHVHLYSRLCNRANSGQPSVNPRVPAMGHPLGAYRLSPYHWPPCPDPAR